MGKPSRKKGLTTFQQVGEALPKAAQPSSNIDPPLHPVVLSNHLLKWVLDGVLAKIPTSKDLRNQNHAEHVRHVAPDHVILVAPGRLVGPRASVSLSTDCLDAGPQRPDLTSLIRIGWTMHWVQPSTQKPGSLSWLHLDAVNHR